eukprot:445346_1
MATSISVLSKQNDLTCNPFHMQFASMKSLSSVQKSFFHQFYSSINSNDRIANTLSTKIQSNISTTEDELRESEIKSITSGFGQFLADVLLVIIIRRILSWKNPNYFHKCQPKVNHIN